jgi:hypothetical protein
MGRFQTTADSRKPSKTGESAPLETEFEVLNEVFGFAIRDGVQARKPKKIGHFPWKTL